jgi:uncharacterized membrane protein
VNAVIQYGVMLCVVAGLVCGALALVVARDARTALRVALDFWVAAGLLRLALEPGGGQLLAVAAIIAIRQLVGIALRRPPPAPGPGSPGPGTAPPASR